MPPAGALATELGLGASAITGVVDRLERAGYARGDPDPTDRRRNLISAEPSTPDLSAIVADLGAAMSAFMAKYDERELAAILDYVTHTIAVLKAQTAPLTTGE